MNKHLRIVLASFVAISIELIVEFLVPDLGGNLKLLLVIQSIIFFVSFAIGGYVARAGFLMPAVITLVTLWFLTLLTHVNFSPFLIAELFDLLARNLLKLTTWVIPSAIGAILGMRLHSWINTREASRNPSPS